MPTLEAPRASTIASASPPASAFALCVGNRGFFSPAMIAGSREAMVRQLRLAGHEALCCDDPALRHGAVETPEEGRCFAAWLETVRDRVHGVILTLPNFGDENGMVAALRDAGMPILVHAWPDDPRRLGAEDRRDAFCGKFSVMDVFCQHGIPFTALKPHAVDPASPRFATALARFARICRVYAGMRRTAIGALGARTTAFKTVRVDELALQRRGVSVETVDLADLLARTRALGAGDADVVARRSALQGYADHRKVPAAAMDNLARLGVAIDRTVADMGLDAIALRCWIEIQKELGISPCVLISALNDGMLAAACEVDVGNAVMMRALSLASGTPSTLLDWNNNWGEEDDKCILFHCGPVPQAMMRERGVVEDHELLQPVLGKGCSWGCNTGRIAAFPFTFGGLLTEDGEARCYLGHGRFTEDCVPPEFFGCAGVAEIAGLQDVLQRIGRAGHRHHVALTRGEHADAVADALGGYLGYRVERV